MKSSSLIKILLLSLILYSCSNESLVGISSSSSRGSVELKINKSTTPPAVQQIVALLSRPDHDTLSSTISVNNDPINVLSFEKVLKGDWQLTVHALNTEGKIIYKGETTVTVLEDETVEIYLTLTPTGSGTGNIIININWGDNKWIDYNYNPIFNNPLIPYGAAQCKIIFDNNKYKMWYTGLFAAGQSEVWYVESSDGINWGSSNSFPVLKKGDQGTWDDYRVGVGAVLKDNNDFKMYYYGWRDQDSAWQIGLAVSNDGINWQKYSSPILPSYKTEFQVSLSDVIKKDNIYFLFYSYRSDPYSDIYKICLAISSDGITWNRYNRNPIISASVPWEGNGISYPTIIFDNNKFIMIYQNQNRTAFGSAISDDGLHWVKNGSNPIFNVDDLKSKWTSYINYPFFRKFTSEYRLYYTGTSYNSVLKLGVAIKY